MSIRFHHVYYSYLVVMWGKATLSSTNELLYAVETDKLAYFVQHWK